jgi:hypothetical protein
LGNIIKYTSTHYIISTDVNKRFRRLICLRMCFIFIVAAVKPTGNWFGGMANIHWNARYAGILLGTLKSRVPTIRAVNVKFARERRRMKKRKRRRF